MMIATSTTSSDGQLGNAGTVKIDEIWRFGDAYGDVKLYRRRHGQGRL